MIITFITSLVLLVLFLSIKLFESYKKRKTVITNFIRKGDLPIRMFILRRKRQLSHINWKNFILLMIHLSRLFHKRVTILKRRLDSRQPRFLIATTPEALNQNNHKKPSSFLQEIVKNKHKSIGSNHKRV